jgi:hypothetical protein
MRWASISLPVNTLSAPLAGALFHSASKGYRTVPTPWRAVRNDLAQMSRFPDTSLLEFIGFSFSPTQTEEGLYIAL